MKKIFLVLPLVLCSCQWVLTHPIEDAEAINLLEQGAVDLYHYEQMKQVPTYTPPTN